MPVPARLRAALRNDGRSFLRIHEVEVDIRIADRGVSEARGRPTELEIVFTPNQLRATSFEVRDGAVVATSSGNYSKSAQRDEMYIFDAVSATQLFNDCCGRRSKC